MRVKTVIDGEQYQVQFYPQTDAERAILELCEDRKDITSHVSRDTSRYSMQSVVDSLALKFSFSEPPQPRDPKTRERKGDKRRKQ